MKNLLSSLFILVGLGTAAPGISPISIASVAALRTLSSGAYATLELQGYYTAGDGGGGLIYWDGTSTATPDSCTVYKPSTNPTRGRWKRADAGSRVERCGAGTGVTNNYPYLVAAMASSKLLQFGSGTYRFATTLKITNAQNSRTFRGASRGLTILQYTGASGDAIQMESNANQITMEDFRVTGAPRDGISITSDTATYPNPDGGVIWLSRLDLRGNGRNGLTSGLTVQLHTAHLEVVQNNGSGIVFPLNSGSYGNVATTWKDDHSWIHSNLGHGVVLDGGLSAILDGTIYDSNGSDSTTRSDSLSVIQYAGYTLFGGGATVHGCVSTDIGKTVTQGGITVGTLAGYDNSAASFVINCSAVPATSGAIAITTGTGSATTTTRRTHNNIGLYARRTIGLHVTGGHVENHVMGIFLDGVTNAEIYPNYILTQGTNAWGIYTAGSCRKINIGGFAVDVQSGGSGDVFFGALSKGLYMVFGHGAVGYTFTNQSPDNIVIKQEDNNGIQWNLKSSSATPFNLAGSDSTGMDALLNASDTTSADRPHAGITMQTNISPGYVRPMYLDYNGDFILPNPAQAKSTYFLSAGGDRVDQRIYWANQSKVPAWSIGPTTGQMTGSNVDANYAMVRYDDAGAFLDTAIKVTRSTGAISLHGATTITGAGTVTGALGVGGALTQQFSLSGDNVLQTIENTSNTASSGARQVMKVAGNSAGNAYFDFIVASPLVRYVVGLNNAASTYEIAVGSALGTGTALSVATTGIITMPGTTDASSSTTGGLVVSGGLGVAKKVYVGTSANVATTIAATSGGSTTGLLFGSSPSLGIYFGSGAPTISAGQGSIYLRTDGSSTTTRAYINTNGSTTWTSITTAL